MRRYEAAVVLLAAALGVGAWVVPVESGGQPWYLGPALFPRLLGLGLVASSIAEVVGWRRARSEDPEEVALSRVAVVAVALVAAAPLAERVGLTATAAALTALGGWLLGTGWRGTVAAVAVVGLLVRVVFIGVLGVGR